MKLVVRIFVFSAVSLLLTAYLIKGFSISYDVKTFLLTTLILAFVYYIIKPITKIVLLPFNILTMGLVSTVAYIAIFYFVLTRLSLATIHPWTFEGYKTLFFTIPKFAFNYLFTIISSAMLYSFFINLLNKVL
jgi:uncharacterized membrane protein YvlD (DUF360 family)